MDFANMAQQFFAQSSVLQVPVGIDYFSVMVGVLTGALFTLAGASKAFACDQGILLSIMLGGITAVGGGALRDIAVGETPAFSSKATSMQWRDCADRQRMSFWRWQIGRWLWLLRYA